MKIFDIVEIQSNCKGGNTMKEIFIENSLGLKVYINDEPSTDNISNEELDHLTTLFKRSFSEYYTKISKEKL